MKKGFSVIRLLVLVVILGAVSSVIIARLYGPMPETAAPNLILPAEKPQRTVGDEDGIVAPDNCTERVVYTEKTEGYSIGTDYCRTGMERADDRIREEVKAITDSFLKDYGEFRTPETEGRFALDITSEEFTFDRYPHIQSVLMTIYIDTAGAHPGLMYRTWTFDRSTDRMIGFRDLFQEEHNPLWTLHPEIKRQLMEREYADENMIDAATGEEDFDNYRNFVVDGDELVVMFEPGTAAAYAAGPQEARVPLDEIQAILKPPFLDLTEIYGEEDLPPDAEVMTYEEVAASCGEAGGTWLEQYDECEYAGREWCEDMGAVFRECESACRHEAEPEICTKQCVPVCEF